MAESTQSLSAIENHFPANRLTDLVLLHNGREQCAPGKQSAAAVLDHYLFNLVLRGSGTLRLEQSVYRLTAGMGFLISPGQLYQCTADREDPWEYLWIGFGGEDAASLLFNSRLAHVDPIYRSERWRELYDYMDSAVAAVRHGGPGSLAYCQGLLLLILSHLVSQAPLFRESRDLTKLSRVQEEYIHRSIAYIQEHLSAFFTVDDIAAELGLNRSYFSRLFTRICGVSPNRFIENYRLDRGWHILRHTSMPIGKIGRAVGYRDPAYFSRRFRARYGVTPASVRSGGNRQD